jgi:hypothetical protein
MSTTIQDLDPALGDQCAQGLPHRNQLRCCDVPAVSRSDDEPVTERAAGDVVSREHVAPSQDLKNGPAECEWSARKNRFGG